jgi:alkanesulfonate monooxygenase SsuD/methylene tetrahydromethanopterin reductase-like flavin-dependent oxidoreductase (luciferase family)
LKEYTRQVQGLLSGEDVLFREGEQERWIRLVHPDHDSFINIKDPIPVYLAANGPRALQAVGELADGWVTTLRARRNLEPNFATIANAAEQAGRGPVKPYTVALTSGCVLREGEPLTSDRVVAQLGPSILVGMHAQWEAAYGPGAALGVQPDADLAAEYNTYIQEYAETSGTPSDRLYLDVHRGHMVFLKPGEARFATENALARTLTGSGPEIIGQLEVMESAGIDNIVVSVPNAQGARDLIQDFSREVIAKRG